MTHPERLWDSGERVPAERHNTLYLELLSAYEAARGLIRTGIVLAGHGGAPGGQFGPQSGDAV